MDLKFHDLNVNKNLKGEIYEWLTEISFLFGKTKYLPSVYSIILTAIRNDHSDIAFFGR